MAVSAQAHAVQPTGIKKKKGRLAPVVQGQAEQGLATKMVTSAKDRALAKEQWEFEKASTNEQIAMQKKQNEFNNTMDWVNTGIAAIGTGFEIAGLLSDWWG